MAGTRDELDVFVRRQRLVGAKALLVAVLITAACYLGYEKFSETLLEAAQGKPSLSVDDPRAVLRTQSDPDRERALDRYRWLFATKVPSYVDELRRFRKRNAAKSGADPGALLSNARQELLGAVKGDQDLLAAFRLLIGFVEDEPDRNREQIAAVFDGINALMSSRGLPFIAEGEVLSEPIALLRVRFYERLEEVDVLVDGESLAVAFVDRVDLTNLYRDPDPPQGRPRTGWVFLRPVWIEANRGLLEALHPEGTGGISRIDPPSELAGFESEIGQKVRTALKGQLESRFDAETLRALEKVSRYVGERNRLYRMIDTRDPSRVVMLRPTTVQLNWHGSAWLTDLEPYAIQGRVRLMLEDITRIREFDRDIGPALEAAAPGLQWLLGEAAYDAAAMEAHREWFVRHHPEPSAVTLKMFGAGDAALADEIVSGHLARAVVTTGSCAAWIGEILAGIADSEDPDPWLWLLDSLDGSTGWSNEDPMSNLEAIRAGAKTLLKTPCDRLRKQAGTLYENWYGEEVPEVALEEAVLADIVPPRETKH